MIRELVKLMIISFTFTSSVKSEKIIIIGAGASGIAAATRLIESNITDFIILEAEARLGGRIHSIYLLDGVQGGHVDLGGEYVGGEDGNVVFEFAKAALKHSDHSKKSKIYYSDGKPVDYELSREILTFKDDLREKFKGKGPVSIADAFLESYKTTILKKYENDTKSYKISSEFINTCENIFLYRQGAFDWSNVLLNDHYEICKGDQGLNWNGRGYRHFLDLLMRKFGDEHRLNLYKFHYSTTVTKISWDNRDKVELESADGQKFETDHVIFTPSVGVLKENHEKLFIPKLPQNKISAIEATGFDSAMKVILQYPKKWWDSDLSDFVFLWNSDDMKKVLDDYPSGPKKDGKSWLTSFVRIFTVTGMENVLIGWFTGPLVPEIEKMTIPDIKDGISYVVKKFLSTTYNVTEPTLVIPSNWYTNPNFRGVYSYERMVSGNRKKQTQEDLAEPLVHKGVPVVVFAGEHTHKTHFSSAHGAVESGYRAADELIQYMNKKQSLHSYMSLNLIFLNLLLLLCI